MKPLQTLATNRSLRSSRSGSVLILVLFAVVIITLGAYTYSELMVIEYSAAQMATKQAQAKQAVFSGAAYVEKLILLDLDSQQDLGGLINNPELFSEQLVVNAANPQLQVYFSVISPGMNEQGHLEGVQFGLLNESSKINLNALVLYDNLYPGSGREILMKLPLMTTEIADSILDWLDEDDQQRTGGAEASDYASEHVVPPNGAISRIEQLLPVRGITTTLLFGLDKNRNGIVDPQEENLPEAGELQASEGEMSLGWSAYLTTYSQEANRNPEGEPRINLNGSDMKKLYDELTQKLDQRWATFIVAYRMSGVYEPEDEDEEQPIGPAEGNLVFEENQENQNNKIKQILDLVDIKVQIQFEGEDEPSILTSPLKDDAELSQNLLLLQDEVTVNPSPIIPGRININVASREVLLTIPGIDEELADKIIAARSGASTNLLIGRRYNTWLYTEKVVEDLEVMKQLVPFITASGNVYRAQIIGYFSEGPIFSRAEIIIDAAGEVPKIINFSERTHLGRGFFQGIDGLGAAKSSKAVP